MKIPSPGLSIRAKLILSIYGTIIFISSVLGYFSYQYSADSVVNKVSIANQATVKQIDANLNFLQREIDDISMQLELHDLVQSFLKGTSSPLYADKSLLFTMSLIAAKSYINLTILYNLSDDHIPFHMSNDGSNGIYPFSVFSRSDTYRKIDAQQGKPYWFRSDDEPLIQNNKYPKIAMGRMVRDLNDYHNIGLLIMFVNEKYIRNLYADNLQTNGGSIAIVDGGGTVISHGGPDFYPVEGRSARFVADSARHREGTLVEKVGGQSMLIAYSSLNEVGWKIYYAVPMVSLTKELNAIKKFTFYIVAGCLVVLLPVMLLLSSLLTLPIKRLLRSMRRFQDGHFDERVKIANNDEIGQLAVGYNTMVASIKDLVNKMYVLQIREREAELSALQAQINPHFLYNTLDLIFWKAQASGDKEIATMIYSLSRFFRISLNRGEGMTVAAREKELIEHYLLLHQKRHKHKLSYDIRFEEDVLPCIIPKLILQPLVENALLHGLEKKKNGGHIVVTAARDGDELRFVVEDDGVGMDEEQLRALLSPPAERPAAAAMPELPGGYAVHNVAERLKLIYGDRYSVAFSSTPGQGTRAEIIVPAEAPATKGGITA
ncbi:sensor histidine kinase [Paenibacillus glycinis]|uniref:HAMP domain-containing protein n=1 Tax=Paenibacillus glycinis TaxID=2697035 RepID=A0ABW9XY03_9BACL|nr:sensor histidine kinase [Paenibacillus glycinis]NBD27117.1 HAMP domain-containing protein [Paenibacillus glycinis]